MIGTRIRTISSHRLAHALLLWTDNGKGFMCPSTKHALGDGAQRLISALLEEVYPGNCYLDYYNEVNSDWFLRGKTLPIDLMEKHATGKRLYRIDPIRLRQEFISRLLTRPDRQLCWLCMSGEEKA